MRNELDARVAEALAELSDAGIPLLNQAVLLRGVNDTVDALGRPVRAAGRSARDPLLPAPTRSRHRCRALRSAGRRTGNRSYANCRERLPGYAVPRYATEIPGVGSKTIS